jgi:hypothetical protein
MHQLGDSENRQLQHAQHVSGTHGVAVDGLRVQAAAYCLQIADDAARYIHNVTV